MRILALSDVVDDSAEASVRASAGRVDLVVGCGDLPYPYLDAVATELGVPLVAVHGNHDTPPDLVDASTNDWWEGIDIHGRVIAVDGLLVGGLGGSARYTAGPFQLSEADAWRAIAGMLPKLVANRILRGRAIDVFVTHAPPRGIHDLPDHAHRGIGAFRWFLRLFRPRYHLHGHSHVYDRRVATRTVFHHTVVVNAYGAREVELDGRR